METINKIGRTFVYVLAGTVISAAIFITLLSSARELSNLLWQIIVMAAVCALGTLFFHSKKVISKNQMIVRIICHYLYINFVVLGGAFLFRWIELGLGWKLETIVMILMVAVVYASITIAMFKKEQIVAENINRRLRKMNHGEYKEDLL